VFLVVKVSGFLYFNGSLLSLEGNSLLEPGNRFDGRIIRLKNEGTNSLKIRKSFLG
jgi:hypothetical protein